MLKPLSLLISAILIVGCATAPSDPNNLIGINPLPNKAVLIAHNDPWGKALIPLQTQYTSYFKKIDGKEVSSFSNSKKQIEVDPGKHTVDVRCSFRRGTALQLTNTIRLTSDFEAGKIYLFITTIEDGTCGINMKVSS